MSLISKVLLLSFLTVLFSCSPHDKDHKRKQQVSEKTFNLALFQLFSKTIKEYKLVVETLKEERDIHNEMVSLYYQANRIHNKIVEKQELGLSALQNLENQIMDLEEILLETEGLPEEVFKKLDAVWLNLHAIQSLINGEEELNDESLIEDLDDFSSTEAGFGVEGNTAVEEADSEAEVDPASEEAGSEAEVDPAVEEADSEAEADPAVEEADSDAEADPASEEAVSEAEADPAVEEADSDAEVDPAVEEAGPEAEVNAQKIKPIWTILE